MRLGAQIGGRRPRPYDLPPKNPQSSSQSPLGFVSANRAAKTPPTPLLVLSPQNPLRWAFAGAPLRGRQLGCVLLFPAAKSTPGRFPDGLRPGATRVVKHHAPLGRLAGHRIGKQLRLPGSNPVPDTNPGMPCGSPDKRPSLEHHGLFYFPARRPDGCLRPPSLCRHKAGGRRWNRRTIVFRTPESYRRTPTERGVSRGPSPWTRSLGTFSGVRESTSPAGARTGDLCPSGFGGEAP